MQPNQQLQISNASIIQKDSLKEWEQEVLTSPVV